MRKTFLIVLFIAGSASWAEPVVAIPPAANGRVICRVVGRHASIVVRAGANGATYAVETKAGETLIEGAGLDKLAMTHPQLAQSIDSMQADASIDTGD